MRRLFIAGNWKMNKDMAGALALVRALKAEAGKFPNVDIGVFPPSVYLPAVVNEVKGSAIVAGAQNMHWEKSGAFTGEVSAQMIKDVGATHVLIGHSERRQFFGETDESVNKKLKAALATGLAPIVCVGEMLAEREAGTTEKVIGTQVRGGLKDLTTEQAKALVLAYEPVWAIGTGKTATPAQAQDVHAFIRATLGDMFGAEAAQAIRIQYGGSVKASNAAELMNQKDIDGALVGGASLEADSFLGIIKG